MHKFSKPSQEFIIFPSLDSLGGPDLTITSFFPHDFCRRSSKIGKWTNDIKNLKLNIPTDKTANLLKELINNYKGESFSDFEKAYKDLDSITSQIKPLTEEQKNKIKDLDKRISDIEETSLRSAIKDWFESQGILYKGTKEQNAFAITTKKNDNIIKFNNEIKKLKEEKAEIQKQEVSINKLLQGLIDKEVSIKENSLQKHNIEAQKAQEEFKNNDFLGDINRCGFKLKKKE